MAAGAAVNQIFDTSLQPQYSSVDLLMRATFTQNSIWDDLGVTHQAYRQAISSILGNAGWNMVCCNLTCLCSAVCCFFAVSSLFVCKYNRQGTGWAALPVTTKLVNFPDSLACNAVTIFVLLSASADSSGAYGT